MNVVRDLPIGAVAGANPVTWLRWVARVWASGLFLLWGAFFVEHLEWFRQPGAWPPAFVLAMTAVHLLMLIGLAAGWRWEAAGGTIVVVCAVVFFAYAAGRRFVPFAVLTAGPGVLWLICAWLSSRGGKRAGGG